MKKILLFIAIFAMSIYITKAASVENTTPSTILSNSEAGPQALEAIVAKDYSSDETRNFTIYGTKEANGKWFFYIPYKGVNYGVRWSNENRCILTTPIGILNQQD